jgi:geranylgeranyl transferase type-2 subunit beta
LYACGNKKTNLLGGIKDFLYRVANEDGSFRPGIDPDYKGTSDTGLSGIAAPTYATILCTTFGWSLPYPDRTKSFFISCQKPDGAFYPPTGSMDPDAPLSRLYNTVQGVVSLRLLESEPRYDPMPVIDYFFEGDRFKDLPLYTTSFFPLFFTAMKKTMPAYIDQKMRDYLIREQKADGYLGDHVASTFHAAHYFRLIGEPVPRAKEMVDRVLNDQKSDGSWHLHKPAWDVHASFDALFILRQLGDPDDPRIKKAYQKATQWILKCHKPDGGFTHFPGEKISDVDAVYFHAGGLVEAGYLQMKSGLKNEEILGWGHAMIPGKHYSCIG